MGDLKPPEFPDSYPGAMNIGTYQFLSTENYHHEHNTILENFENYKVIQRPFTDQLLQHWLDFIHHLLKSQFKQSIGVRKLQWFSDGTPKEGILIGPMYGEQRSVSKQINNASRSLKMHSGSVLVFRVRKHYRLDVEHEITDDELTK